MTWALIWGVLIVLMPQHDHDTNINQNRLATPTGLLQEGRPLVPILQISEYYIGARELLLVKHHREGFSYAT